MGCQAVCLLSEMRDTGPMSFRRRDKKATEGESGLIASGKAEDDESDDDLD